MAAKVKQIKGAWWVVTHHHGRRTVKRIGPTKAHRQQAEKIAEKINGALALGQFRLDRRAAPPVPFDSFAEDWLRREVDLPLQRQVDGHLAPTTARNYRSHVRTRLIPFFGTRNVRTMTKTDVQAFYDRCLDGGKPRSPRSIQRILVALSLIMKHAVKVGLLERNPVSDWRDGAVDESKRRSFSRRVAEEQVLSGEELGQLLTAAQEVFPQYYEFILFLADTGCRLGEATALRWIDLDLDAGTASICRSLSSGTHLGPTKTGEARGVELSRRLQEALRSLPRPDIHPPDALVFHNGQGGFIDQANFRNRVFRRLVETAIGRRRRLTPHALRHTFASLHLSRGSNPLWVQRMGGWRSAVVMLDTYAHFLPKELGGFSDALGPSDGSKRHYMAPATSYRRARGVSPADKPSRDKELLEPTIRFERTTCSLREGQDPEG